MHLHKFHSRFHFSPTLAVTPNPGGNNPMSNFACNSPTPFASPLHTLVPAHKPAINATTTTTSNTPTSSTGTVQARYRYGTYPHRGLQALPALCTVPQVARAWPLYAVRPLQQAGQKPLPAAVPGCCRPAGSPCGAESHDGQLGQLTELRLLPAMRTGPSMAHRSVCIVIRTLSRRFSRP